MKKAKPFLILLGAVILSGAMYLLAQYGVETFFSDAATRLAFQIRDEARALLRSGEPTRTFAHYPKAWPEGVSGDYRIEIVEAATSPRPGHRSIGVTRDPGKPTWYSTSFHLNFVEVPKDLIVSKRKGEPTMVTLEMTDGKVLLTRLK